MMIDIQLVEYSIDFKFELLISRLFNDIAKYIIIY